MHDWLGKTMLRLENCSFERHEPDQHVDRKPTTAGQHQRMEPMQPTTIEYGCSSSGLLCVSRDAKLKYLDWFF